MSVGMGVYGCGCGVVWCGVVWCVACACVGVVFWRMCRFVRVRACVCACAHVCARVCSCVCLSVCLSSHTSYKMTGVPEVETTHKLKVLYIIYYTRNRTRASWKETWIDSTHICSI